MQKLIPLLAGILLSALTFVNGQSHKLMVEPYTFTNLEGDEVAAELGKFTVPENRQKPNGNTIELHFVRFKSTNPNPSFPIVYLAGGPGGSGINTAKGPRFELFMALREVADVIAFDQRGTGLSKTMPPCSTTTPFPLNEPGTTEAYVEHIKANTKKCLDFWREEGFDLSGYNTKESADDLEDLRKTLGVDKLNLWGISYGSHLAFAAVKRHPDSWNRIALAGLEGPDHTIKRPAYNQAFLEYLASKVKADPKAGKVYPDVLGSMKKVLTKLETEPVVTKAKHPQTGMEFEVGISKLDLQLVTSFFMLKNPSNSKDLPFIYHQLENGDFSTVTPWVGGLKMYSGRVSPMSFAMDAMSGISPERWDLIQEEAKTALLGRTTNFPFPDVTDGMGLPDLGDEFRKNPTSSIPSLFFSGTLDGRTYLPSAKELIKGFENGIHVVIDGAGHDLFLSTPKVKSLLVDFFGEKSVMAQTIEIPMPIFTLPKDK
ncbi:MAG: alpha/beta hydrolase [Saprospiraceae bacterium]|nr:alpha/beta hydrolase [Saprospiraceae bacterium]